MSENSDLAHSESVEDGNVSADRSGPVSRSSVTHVAYIISKFDEVKKDLVRQIGFEGILELPHITKVDRKFTLWLLTKLDPDKRSIIINHQCVTDVIDYEVARILGIPCGSREVCSLDSPDKKAKQEFVHNFIGTTDLECNSLTAAENNVTTQYVPPITMTLKDKDNFKVSFVVWVMGHLLAPTKKHNVGGDRFWGALLAPDEINQFNWSAYVIDELMIAARDVQTAVKQKKPISAITGCPILLQILYFESINMGSLNRPVGISPRVKVYDGKSLSVMIAADKASSATGGGNATWGSCVRGMTQVRNESVHLASQRATENCINDITPKNFIIKDFGTYVRDNFGDKVDPTQSVALSWFHARCTRHLQQLRHSIQEDTIALVAKLFGSPVVTMHPVPSELIPSNAKPRQAQSEPYRRPMYGRTTQNNKRQAESYSNPYNQRATKKAQMSPRRYALPDTLLSGMSVSDEHEVVDELSDSDYHSRTVSHNFDCNMDVPSFDLGIQLNTDEKQLPCSGGSNNFVDTSEQQSLSVCDNQKLASGAPRPPTTLENASISTIGQIDNSTEIPDSKYMRTSTSVTLFTPLSSTPPSAKKLEETLFTTPDQRIKSFSTSPRTLSKILAEGDLVERMTRGEDSPNINIKPWDDDYLDSPIKKHNVDTPNMVDSPWTYNLCHRNPPEDIVFKFFDDVSVCNNSSLSSPWIAHTCPRHIEIDGTWIHRSFIMQTGLSYDVFDISIRRLKQLDDIMYDDSNSHWRHILESEFAMFALAGEVPYNRKSIVYQFIGSSIHYKIENCQMIVVPAFILLNWSCYFFDLKGKRVHIIDPLYKDDESDMFKQMHHPNISKVATSLANCFQIFFGNWNHNMQDWNIDFVQPPILDATSSETGLLTLMYIREFDGAKINLANREYFQYFKKLMLYELMCLSENHAKPPVNPPITIDD